MTREEINEPLEALGKTLGVLADEAEKVARMQEAETLRKARLFYGGEPVMVRVTDD